jgi:hypothetical protein
LCADRNPFAPQHLQVSFFRYLYPQDLSGTIRVTISGFRFYLQDLRTVIGKILIDWQQATAEVELVTSNGGVDLGNGERYLYCSSRSDFLFSQHVM